MLDRLLKAGKIARLGHLKQDLNARPVGQKWQWQQWRGESNGHCSRLLGPSQETAFCLTRSVDVNEACLVAPVWPV